MPDPTIVYLRSKTNNQLMSAVPGPQGASGPTAPPVFDTLATGLYQQYELCRLVDGVLTPIDFSAPVPTPPNPTPPDPTPGPTPPPGADAFDLSQAVVASADCPSVAHLPILSAISQIELKDVPTDQNGYAMNFPGRDTWPGVVPPGWDGPINHTLWMAEQIGGVWYILPIKEGLHDYLTLGPILAPGQVPNNLTYFASLPMLHFQPPPGSQVGFFVTTGDTRRMDLQPPTGAGRSNVVLVPFTAGLYSFA